MPYFITDSAAGCSGWATTKDDGEVIGCHTTKQAAIDQMVAVSIAEGMEPGGERSVKANEVRQVELDVPEYIREAARRGLDYYGQGLGGDGLVARTIREAREMARGEISEDKVIRANAWGKRHLVDLEAPQNSDPDNDQFPGAGAVAFYLWGINPLDPEPAMDWFGDAAELIRGEEDDMDESEDMDDMDDDEMRVRRLLVLERLSRLFLDK